MSPAADDEQHNGHPQAQHQRFLRIGFQNIQGMGGAAEYVKRLMKEQELDLLCVVETWMTPGANNPFKNLSVADVRQPLAAQGRQGQEGIMVIARNLHILQEVRLEATIMNNRAVIVVVDGIRMVFTYLPPRPALDDQLQQLVDSLEETTNQYRGTLIVGDINAKHRWFESASTNQRGTWLERLHEETDWMVAKPVEGHHTTNNNRPDHIIQRGMEVVDFRVLEEIVTTSDHQPMTFSVAVGPARTNYSYSRLNVGRLREEVVMDQYRATCIHRFGGLQEELMSSRVPNVDDPMEQRQEWTDQTYERIRNFFLTIATEIVGVSTIQKVRAKEEFRTAELVKAEEYVASLNTIRRHGSDQHKRWAAARLGTAKKKLREIIQHRRRWIFQEAADAIDQEETNVFQKMVSCLKKREARTGCQLETDRLEEYSRYFETTFGGRPGGTRPVDEQIIEQTEPGRPMDHEPLDLKFDQDEVNKQIKWMKNGKAGGIDGISAELLKIKSFRRDRDNPEDQIAARVLTWFFTKITKIGAIPSLWRQVLVVPVWKQKGNQLEIENYRPISLTSVVRRLYEKCILSGFLYQKIDQKLCDTQGGFRERRSTYHQVLVVHEACVSNPRAWKVFLDIKAAYDCVNRGLVWSELRNKFGLELREIQLLRLLFDGNQAVLQVKNHRGPWFEIKRGLVQGSSISPILFNAFINGLIERLNQVRSDIQLSGSKVNNAFFADDGALMTNSRAKMDQLLRTTEDWARETGTTFAPSKCEVMGPPTQRPFQLDGTDLPTCTEFRYLGMWMNNKGIDWAKSTHPRIKKMKQMASFLNTKGFNGYGWTERCNVTVYRSFLRPMMEYGMGMAMLPKTQLDKIEQAQAWALRKSVSMAKSTSTYALLGILNLDTMTFRNEKLNGRFMARVHNGLDGRIPAIRIYWNRRQEQNITSKSLVIQFNKNPAYQKLQLRQGFDKRPTRTRTNEIIEDEESLDETNIGRLEEHRLESRKKLFEDQGTRTARWTVDLDNIGNKGIHPLLRPNVIPDRQDRRTMLMWLAGRVCYHQECRNCGESTSRRHGVQCSGADEPLRYRFRQYSGDHSTDDEACLLDVIANRVAFAPTSNYRKMEQAEWIVHAINMVREECTGMRTVSTSDEEEQEREQTAEEAQAAILLQATKDLIRKRKLEDDEEGQAPPAGTAASRTPSNSRPIGRPRKQPRLTTQEPPRLKTGTQEPPRLKSGSSNRQGSARLKSGTTNQQGTARLKSTTSTSDHQGPDRHSSELPKRPLQDQQKETNSTTKRIKRGPTNWDPT